LTFGTGTAAGAINGILYAPGTQLFLHDNAGSLKTSVLYLQKCARRALLTHASNLLYKVERLLSGFLLSTEGDDCNNYDCEKASYNAHNDGGIHDRVLLSFKIHAVVAVSTMSGSNCH
jgi:hypothetical protein